MDAKQTVVEKKTVGRQKSVTQENNENTLQRQSKPGSLAVGVTVRTKEIKSKPELNGLTGTVESYNKENDRWAIRVTTSDGKKKVLELKDKNLEVIIDYVNSQESSQFATGISVQIQGLMSRPEYNATEGTIVGWSDKNKRWKIKMEFDGALLELKEKNLLKIDKLTAG